MSQQESSLKLSVQTLITILTTVGALVSIYVNVSERLTTMAQISKEQSESLKELKDSDDKEKDAINDLKARVGQLEYRMDSLPRASVVIKSGK